MAETGRALAAVVAGYALGNLPSADVALRFAGQTGDLRRRGSHNPGAMNAGRELGPTWGLAVLAADAGKGALAAHLGRSLAGPNAANLASAAAVVGHCHPATGRSGGKGVATSIGQVLGTFPRYLPVDAGIALATSAVPGLRQRTWTATAVASIVWVGAATIAWRRGWRTGTDTPAPVGLPAAALVSSLVIAARFAATPLDDGEPISSDGDEPRRPSAETP